MSHFFKRISLMISNKNEHNICKRGSYVRSSLEIILVLVIICIILYAITEITYGIFSYEYGETYNMINGCPHNMDQCNIKDRLNCHKGDIINCCVIGIGIGILGGSLLILLCAISYFLIKASYNYCRIICRELNESYDTSIIITNELENIIIQKND
jgi:hypothetical protein